MPGPPILWLIEVPALCTSMGSGRNKSLNGRGCASGRSALRLQERILVIRSRNPVVRCCVTLVVLHEGLTLNQLDWLLKHRFVSAIRREFDWVFVLDGNANLVVECLWRLVEGNRICLTSLDDGQQFGLPTPVDATKLISSRLTNAEIEAVVLREGTLDLQLKFSNGQCLEIIPDSSGYEAWKLLGADRQFVAIGGGDLAVFQDISQNRAEQTDERERE